MRSFFLVVTALIFGACTKESMEVEGEISTPTGHLLAEGELVSAHPDIDPEPFFHEELTNKATDEGMAVTETVSFASRRCLDLEILGLAAGDIDGDGNVDIVLPNCEEVLFLAGNGDGTLLDA